MLRLDHNERACNNNYSVGADEIDSHSAKIRGSHTMRKLLLILLVLFSAGTLLMQTLLRVAQQHLSAAMNTATGMGAKLACSGRYLSGLSEAQLSADVATYSPANRLLEYRYDATNSTVSARMLGISSATAK